jgi:sterol desaturase/sphingolipid hydroxylase (fatty acid hydroxylase superfamily)
MHEYKPLKKFHKIHHDDITPTPLSSLSFHPVEALINFSFYLIIVFLIPMTKIDLYIVYLYMLVNNTLGHMPLEFCPRWFYKFKLSSLFNAATHHIMHHRNGSSNFSLYYLFWDIKRKTMNRKYYEEFNKVQDSIDSKK